MDYFDYEIIHTLKNQWDSYMYILPLLGEIYA